MGFELGKESIHTPEETNITSMLHRLKDFPTYPVKEMDNLFVKTLPPELSFSSEEIMTSLGIKDNNEQYPALNSLITSLHETVFTNNKLPGGADIYNDRAVPLANMIAFDRDTHQINISDLKGNIVRSFEICLDGKKNISINEKDGKARSLEDLQFSLDEYGSDALGIQGWSNKDNKTLVHNNAIYPSMVQMSSLYGNYGSAPAIQGVSTYGNTARNLDTDTNAASNIDLQENSSVTIRSSLLNSSSHTLDTVFSEPNPQELIIQNPGKEEMRVRHDGNGYVSHLHNKRPPIYPGVKITNIGGSETTKKVNSGEQISIPQDKAIVLEDVEEKKLADICTKHKNTTFSVDYGYTRRPDKGRTVAERNESKGSFVDRDEKYVAIYDGVRLEEISSSEDTESNENLAHQQVIDQIQGGCFDANDLGIDQSYSSQLQTYLTDHFDDNSIHIEDNTSTRDDVYIENDMLYFAIDNNEINKAYHKNLSLPLDNIVTNGTYQEDIFKTKLGAKITNILDQQYPVYNNVEENEGKYETVEGKTQTSKDELQYKPKESYKTPTMTYCARSTREFATNNMGLTFDPIGSAKDAVSHKHVHAETYKIEHTPIQINKQCPQMSVREITELLDQNLPKANFVDAGYHSNTKNGREHGHRNCFVHVKGEGWMVYDPVWPFSGEKKGELRPIKDMLEYSNSLRFKELAYYNAPTEVVA